MIVEPKNVYDAQRGPICACSICKEPLMSTARGVHSHLKKHVRAGLLKRQDLIRVKLEILHRKYRSG